MVFDLEVVMTGILVLFGTLAVVIVGGWLLRRRLEPVDSYYEREYQGPPVFDAGTWLGGDR